MIRPLCTPAELVSDWVSAAVGRLEVGALEPNQQNAKLVKGSRVGKAGG